MNGLTESSNLLTVPMDKSETVSPRRVSFVDNDDDKQNGIEDVSWGASDGAWAEHQGSSGALGGSSSAGVGHGGGMSFMYERVMMILLKKPEERLVADLIQLVPWFKKRVGLLARLETDVLLDLLRHSQLISVKRNHIVFKQGEVGTAFFGVLSGQVSVMMRDMLDIEEDLDDEFAMSTRSQLGAAVETLTVGKTFGELALLSDDSVRSASIIADEATDLICITKDVYNRTVAQLINEEYNIKLKFVNENPMFKNWSSRGKKMLAVCIIPQSFQYDQVLVKQGERATHMYFITSGEIKLTAEPDGHKELFGKFMEECTGLLDEEEDENLASKYFSIAKYMSAKSRRSKRLKSAPSVERTEEPKTADMSPSAKRKLLESAKLHAPKFNICFLEAGQIVGDIEFLLGFDHFHANATCTMDSKVLAIHKEHFERLFQKRNPGTVKTMQRQLSLNMHKRTSRSELVQNIPLLKSIVLKIQELNGERRMRKKLKDEDLALPFVDSNSSTYSRVKSVYSSRTFPLMSNQTPRSSGFYLGDTHPPIVMPHLPPAPNKTLQFVSQSYVPEGAMDSQVSFGNSAGDNSRDPNSDAEYRPNVRDGIFAKLMQLSNPGVERRHLQVGDEEYQYLVQLRRRMAKQLKDFYPYKSSEHILTGSSSGMDSARTPRSSRLNRGGLPILSPSPRITRKTAMKNTKADAQGKNVNFSLPKF